jgi:ketosteroid isomerase-like protein
MLCVRALVLASLLVAAGTSGATEPANSQGDVQAIDALYANWRLAVEHGDIPGYVAVLHEDVRLLPPDAEPVVGAANYAKFLEPVFATANYRIEVIESPVIEVFDDVALAEYQYVIHLALKNPEVGVEQPGALTAERTAARYVDVLRRDAAGRWAVYRHAWQNKSN